MAAMPEIRYAKSGDIHVAYQLAGDGSRDLVVVFGFVSNLEVQWEIPGYAPFIRQLASFCRVLLFDERGTGLSDRVPTRDLPTLEERMDDVRAAMDAAEVEKATLLGISEGGPMSVLFASTHPTRVDGLILYGSYARRPVPEGGWESFLGKVEDRWGTGEMFSTRAPSAVRDDQMQALLARLERQSASPADVAAIFGWPRRSMSPTSCRPSPCRRSSSTATMMRSCRPAEEEIWRRGSPTLASPDYLAPITSPGSETRRPSPERPRSS